MLQKQNKEIFIKKSMRLYVLILFGDANNYGNPTISAERPSAEFKSTQLNINRQGIADSRRKNPQ